MARYPSKTYEADNSKLLDPRTMTLPEYGEHQPIEPITESQAKADAVALEAFMNEILTIRIPRSPIPGTLATVTPNVNGVNMPIVRGVPTMVKRKYVEALAQSSAFDYAQESRNPADLSDIEMVETRTLAYPFEVLKDPSGEKGFAWLENIMMAP